MVKCEWVRPVHCIWIHCQHWLLTRMHLVDSTVFKWSCIKMFIYSKNNSITCILFIGKIGFYLWNNLLIWILKISQMLCPNLIDFMAVDCRPHDQIFEGIICNTICSNSELFILLHFNSLNAQPEWTIITCLFGPTYKSLGFIGLRWIVDCDYGSIDGSILKLTKIPVVCYIEELMSFVNNQITELRPSSNYIRKEFVCI